MNIIKAIIMNINIPMLPSYVPKFLYKYTSVAYALDVLRTEEVYFSHRQQLNDPFDGRYMMDASTLEKRKEAIKEVIKEIEEHEKKGHDLSGMPSGIKLKEYHERFITDEKFANEQMQKNAKNMDVFNIGVYCLAEQNDSIVMWAHYANNHQGCCLEFNFQEHSYRHEKERKRCFPFSFINMVKYSDKYPVRVFGEGCAYPEENSFYMCKSKDWQYEKEWRAIMHNTRFKGVISSKSFDSEISDKSIKIMKGSGRYPLDTNLLQGIILGCKMKDDEKKSIIKAARVCGIRIYQAKPKLYEYGMEMELLRR